ncbi:hypothetical protein BCR33DRAFT_767867 [Rhizoclosmatium globosum]|uniref:Response regulatory domain-containing protein n=1 Tax=Rhizoclosmatium globosum TaxID=329046 RepID=A0A1Y2C0X8_9FUNG|nr:hypothetical protein BCR33DRAFT_767867 [Rhizoclosmatium globosum]|eukprot:ORY40692.1 hypothetical protein BCR33DRAFT_767867 [Rhizoclosmatium globosum]
MRKSEIRSSTVQQETTLFSISNDSVDLKSKNRKSKTKSPPARPDYPFELIRLVLLLGVGYGLVRVSVVLSKQSIPLVWTANGVHAAGCLVTDIRLRPLVSLGFIGAVFAGLLELTKGASNPLPMTTIIALSVIHALESIMLAVVLFASTVMHKDSSHSLEVVKFIAAAALTVGVFAVCRSLVISLGNDATGLSLGQRVLLDWSAGFPGLLIMVPMVSQMTKSHLLKFKSCLSDRKLIVNVISPVIASGFAICIPLVLRSLIPDGSSFLSVYTYFPLILGSGYFGGVFGVSIASLSGLLSNLGFGFIWQSSALDSITPNFYQGHLPILHIHSIAQIVGLAVIHLVARKDMRHGKTIANANKKLKTMALEMESLKKEALSAKEQLILKESYIPYLAEQFREPLVSVATLWDGDHDCMKLLPSDFKIGISQNLGIMLSLTEDITSYFNLEKGNLILKPTQTSIQSVIYSTMSSVREMFCGITFEHQINNIPAVALVDSSRFEQAISSIFIAACKYSARDGKVVLRSSGKQVSHSSLSRVDKIHEIETSVTFGGIGISFPIDTLFVPYNMMRCANVIESGLGLATAKKLVGLMKGDINATKLSKGVNCITFTVQVTVPAVITPISRLPSMSKQQIFSNDNVAADLSSNRSSASSRISRVTFKDIQRSNSILSGTGTGPRGRLSSIDSVSHSENGSRNSLQVSPIREASLIRKVSMTGSPSFNERRGTAENTLTVAMMARSPSFNDKKRSSMDNTLTVAMMARSPSFNDKKRGSIENPPAITRSPSFNDKRRNENTSTAMVPSALATCEVMESIEKLKCPSTTSIVPVLTGPGHVLIVDDSKVFLKLVSKFIIDVDPTAIVIEASNGAEAVKSCQRAMTELIIMDLEMPIMDGTETLKTLRENNVLCPVLIVSSYSLGPETQSNLEKNGMTAFIQKPLTKDIIADILKQYYRPSLHRAFPSRPQPVQEDPEIGVHESSMPPKETSKNQSVTFSDITSPSAKSQPDFQLQQRRRSSSSSASEHHSNLITSLGSQFLGALFPSVRRHSGGTTSVEKTISETGSAASAGSPASNNNVMLSVNRGSQIIISSHSKLGGSSHPLAGAPTTVFTACSTSTASIKSSPDMQSSPRESRPIRTTGESPFSNNIRTSSASMHSSPPIQRQTAFPKQKQFIAESEHVRTSTTSMDSSSDKFQSVSRTSEPPYPATMSKHRKSASESHKIQTSITSIQSYSEGKPVPRASEPVRPTAIGTKTAALVVDDSLVNRSILAKMLKAYGKFADVLEVSNGTEAIRIVQQRKVSIVFMDLEMPGMSGEEATVRIRAAGYTMPIVAVTGNLVLGNNDGPLKNAGMHVVLKKPVEKGQVFDVCRTLLFMDLDQRNSVGSEEGGQVE